MHEVLGTSLTCRRVLERMLNLIFDDALLLSEEWESENLLPRLREQYGSWLRTDLQHVGLEGGAWGVGLVLTYQDGREFRELVDLLEEDPALGFCVEEGADRNAEKFYTLSFDTLHTNFATALFATSDVGNGGSFRKPST